MFYLISNQLNEISKIGSNKRYPLLSEEFENEKKKKKNILTSPSRDLNPRFQ